MPVRAPLIVKNSQEKVGGKRRRTLRRDRPPRPVVADSIFPFFDIRVFSLPYSSTAAIVLRKRERKRERRREKKSERDSRIARKVSYIYVIIEPAFLPSHTWRALSYRGR